MWKSLLFLCVAVYAVDAGLFDEPVQEFSCHHCQCQLCGDPQLTACNKSTIHIGMDSTNDDGEVVLMHASGEPSVHMQTVVKLSHVPGEGPNHLRKDWIGGHVKNDLSNVGIYYKMDDNALQVSELKPGGQLSWITVTNMLPPFASPYITLIRNTPSGAQDSGEAQPPCYEFHAIRGPGFDDIKLTYCRGCIAIDAAEDLFRDGACQDPHYHGHASC